MLYKTIDLCAGIGGIRRGFEMTGKFINVLSSEIDKYACKTYEHLYGENPYNDITTEDFKRKIESVNYDVLLAGFPCQSFSRQGRELGFQDEKRGIIFYHIADIIKRTLPKAVFLENVDNLVRHDKGKTFETILSILEEELNYSVIGADRDDNNRLIYKDKNFVRNSKYFGVPQNRPRTYIMAFNREYYQESIKNLPHVLPVEKKDRSDNDLSNILELGADAKYYLSSGYLNTLVRHKERNKNKGNGFGYKVVNSSDISSPIANTLLAVGGSGKERNLIYDPQDNIPGMIYPRKKTPLNDNCIRFMTPREWGKLQGFIEYGFMEGDKDTFSFPTEISDFQQYKQFGNSVTVQVIESMAEFMLLCFDEMQRKKIRVIGQKVCVESATNLDRYGVCSTFIFF